MQPSAETGVPTYVHALNSDTVAGYGVLDDINGEPALVLEVDLPRDIHHQGQVTLLYLICAIAVIAVVTGIVGSYAVQRSFLLPSVAIKQWCSQGPHHGGPVRAR